MAWSCARRPNRLKIFAPAHLRCLPSSLRFVFARRGEALRYEHWNVSCHRPESAVLRAPWPARIGSSNDDHQGEDRFRGNSDAEPSGKQTIWHPDASSRNGYAEMKGQACRVVQASRDASHRAMPLLPLALCLWCTTNPSSCQWRRTCLVRGGLRQVVYEPRSLPGTQLHL
ncbi:hypothetical protein GY45DRAFT_835582 [Cubamyces sp. BRFM 1775]|nr:hypothetical protein GY45DRAFT_835582 [Cubamyces sp. BRFM 1775]